MTKNKYQQEYFLIIMEIKEENIYNIENGKESIFFLLKIRNHFEFRVQTKHNQKSRLLHICLEQ